MKNIKALISLVRDCIRNRNNKTVIVHARGRVYDLTGKGTSHLTLDFEDGGWTLSDRTVQPYQLIGTQFSDEEFEVFIHGKKVT